ncbi:unnamed protein product, partial [Ranitomeya imitator]
FIMADDGEQQPQLLDKARQEAVGKEHIRSDQSSRKSSSRQGSRASTGKEPPRVPVPFSLAYTAEESASTASLKEMIRMEVKKSLRSLSQAESSKQRASVISDSSEEDKEEGSYGSILSSSSSGEDSGRFCLPLDRVDKLVKSVRGTMGLEEPKTQLSRQELMFSGLEHKKRRSFPVNDKIQDLILREWKKPEKKGSLPPALKRRYPFEDAAVDTWDKAPKLDATVAKASKRAALPFEDMGSLKDPLDRKADTFLKDDDIAVSQDRYVIISQDRNALLGPERREEHRANIFRSALHFAHIIITVPNGAHNLNSLSRMRADEVVMQRLLKSYKLMLRFYGIQLLDEKTGEVSRAAEWKERYHNLSRHSHNNLRITRILKCLGEMGYDHLQAPLVQFFLEETLCNKQLPNVKRSVLDYFMFTVKDKQQRRRLVQFAWENYTSRGPFIWGPVDKLQNLRAKKEKENEGTTEEMESKEENPGPPCKDLHQHLQHQTRTEDMGDDSRSGVGRIQDHQASEQRDAVTRSRNEQQTTEDNSSGFELQITEDSSSATKQLITEYCSSGNEQLKTENNSLRNERPITEDNEGLTTAETSSVNKNLITRTTQHGEHQAEGSENEEKEKLMSGQEDRIGNNGILDILLSFGGFCCFLCCMSGSSNVRKG